MIARLIEHLIWADRRTIDSLATLPVPAPELARIQAHVLGSQATWIARIEGEHPTVPVWPELDVAGCRALAEQTHAALRDLVGRLEDPNQPRSITYTNTKGETYTSAVDDILYHVVMHAMYHRGQVMIGIRQQGGEPLATDFIVFTRER